MAQFNWDNYEDAAPGPGKSFDWDSYEDAVKPGGAESAVMHGLQGATAGFLDELSGLGEAAGRVVGVKGVGGSFADLDLAEGGPTLDRELLKEAYINARDKKRQILETQAKAHPGVTAASEVAGMVISPANKIAKGATLATGSAALGGLHAAGSSDADNARDLLVDTAVGTGTGLVLGKAAEKASPIVQKGVDKVAKGSKELAKRFAARALGAERGTIKSIGFDKVKAAGGQALDEGVLSPLASTDDLVVRNKAVKSKGGKMMGQAYEAIDEAGASTFNPLEVASKVDEQLGGFYRSPINKAETTQLENTLETILMRGDKNIPLREAQTLKEELNKVANWKNKLQITDKEKMAREAYRIVSEHIDDAVAKGSETVEKAGLSGVLKKGKDLFSKASTTEQLLENKVAREQGNKLIGLTDAITGAGALGYGGTTGDWETAAGVVLGKKMLQKYGAQNAALALNRISKALGKSPQMVTLAKNNPGLFQTVVGAIAKNGSKALPRAAENEEFKGKDKWAVDGFSKLMEHDKSVLDKATVEKIFQSEKGKQLLIQASDLKPRSKAMQSVLEKISALAAKSGRNK
ncbi:MAG: hypothetical protein AB7G93_09500 [Bdellovibrionales bacterium]